MRRRHLRYMSRAGKRPLRRVRDRRSFADVTASEQMRKLKHRENSVDQMGPKLGLTDATAVTPTHQRGVVPNAPDVVRSNIGAGRRRTCARSGRQ
jgi:hypothetical protein